MILRKTTKEFLSCSRLVHDVCFQRRQVETAFNFHVMISFAVSALLDYFRKRGRLKIDPPPAPFLHALFLIGHFRPLGQIKIKTLQLIYYAMFQPAIFQELTSKRSFR